MQSVLPLTESTWLTNTSQIGTEAVPRLSPNQLRRSGKLVERQRDSGGPRISGETYAERRLEIEQQLKPNELKVVAATSALGMGFDKPRCTAGVVLHSGDSDQEADPRGRVGGVGARGGAAPRGAGRRAVPTATPRVAAVTS